MSWPGRLLWCVLLGACDGATAPGGGACLTDGDCEAGSTCRAGTCAPRTDGPHADSGLTDAAPDAAVDAARDARPPVDAAPPVDGPPIDAAPDATPSDAASDARVSIDAGPDARGTDAAADAAPDAAPDAVLDAGAFDAAVDAEVDAAPDAGPDADPGDCPPGLERACGPSTGRCEPGVQLCLDDATWGECLGARGPAEETCNTLDDDCDGRTDEALELACERGACQGGLRQCVGGEWGPCEDADVDVPESCNGDDDDCDGAVDEDVTRPCGRDVGVCRAGVERCVGGLWQACEGGVSPSPETCDGRDEDCNGLVDDAQASPEDCNGRDDDCDGQIDEGILAESCGPPVGECRAGARACENGAWTSCIGAVGPVPETCDGRDEDCDGITDDDVPPAPCEAGEGRCHAGFAHCEGGQWSACRDPVGPRAEACDGIDDDCDGQIDESAPGLPCGNLLGECRGGVRRCVDGRHDEVCEGERAPRPEACNGLDDDCDGLPDDGFPDRDRDTANDCLEELAGLDPDDPTDALGDPDHDGVLTADELRAGTQWRPMLSLALVATEDPDQFDVSIVIDQTFPDLQPDIAEIYLQFTEGRASYAGVRPGASAIASDKRVSAALRFPGVLRMVVVGANLNRMPPGELARVRFRRESPDRIFLRFSADLTRMTPDEAQAALTFGDGHPAFPVTVR